MSSQPVEDIDSQIDPEDFLSDSLQTLYDYAPITHSSAGSLFRYTPRPPSESAPHSHPPSTAGSAADASVVTLVTPTTQASNWALHASSIWTSAIFVADHIQSLRLDAHVAGARARGGAPLRMLELGAGAGLPSIVVAKMHEDVRVTASDYPDEALIRALRENVRRNGVEGRCRVVPYAWGSDAAVFHEPAAGTSAGEDSIGFDVVLAADTLWNPDLHSLFLRTLQLTLRRTLDARIHLVAGLHTGRYTLQAFMRMLEEYGFEMEEAVEREASGEQCRAWDISRAEGEEEKERRRWVVDMRIKWKNV